MELSKAPRLTPFTAWGWSCVGTSVLEGGKGAAGGGGGGGGGGGNVEIPVEEKGDSQHHLPTARMHATAQSWAGQTGKAATGFPQNHQDVQYCVIFKILNKKARRIKGEFQVCHFSHITVM